MDQNNVPDYSALKGVAQQLHDFLLPGTLVIVESTVEPGFIENELIPIIEGDDKKFEALLHETYKLAVREMMKSRHEDGHPCLDRGHW